jgi:hypothetical protein
MGNGNLFDFFWSLVAGGNGMNGMEYIGRIIAIATIITNTNGDIFQNNEPISVFKGFLFN